MNKKVVKKIAFSLAFIVIFMISVNISAVDVELHSATNLTEQTVFTSDVNAASVKNLKDNVLKTKWKHNGKATITLTSPQKIYSIYMVSDKPLGTWSIESDGQMQTCGEGAFIHDCVELKNPSTTISIKLDSNDLSLCDISVFSQGVLPNWVENWNMPYEKADMLVISTHADDEHLWFGGTMPTYAGERKLKVQVAYITNHWTEWYRPHELLAGLWTVGISAYPIIGGFPDKYAADIAQAEKMYKRDDVVKYEVMLIRRFKPEVIIAQDLNGEYGHGMHILGAQSACKAAQVSADPNEYHELSKKFGTWDPKKLYLHLYDKNTIVMNWDKPLERFNGRTSFEMAQLGFACHKSQVKHFAVKKSGKYDCRKFGLYRSLVGDDKDKDDFFENIKLQDQKPEVSQSSEIETSSNYQEVNSVDSLNSGIIYAEPNEVKPVIHTRHLIIIGLIVIGTIALSATAIIVINIRKKNESKNAKK